MAGLTGQEAHGVSNIRVVLLNTSHPGNIGAAARAMKTMGLDVLWLVSPREFPHADATARASGADDVLAGARVCARLDEALEDCPLVIGASARERSIPCPVVSPRECARLAERESRISRVAILFGCEQSGLSNDVMDRCQYLVRIPANPAYSSLNLAAAVQLIAYELFVARTASPADNRDDARAHVPVSAGEMERFYAHLEHTLVELGFLDPANPRQLMRRLRRLYNRARPDANEINILRGILTAARPTRK
jgi:TrmH family RNA methyltransferase